MHICIYDTGDRHCALTVRSNGGHSDITSRYLIWFAATELHNVCLRRGKTGRRDNLGKSMLCSAAVSIYPSIYLASLGVAWYGMV